MTTSLLDISLLGYDDEGDTELDDSRAAAVMRPTRSEPPRPPMLPKGKGKGGFGAPPPPKGRSKGFGLGLGSRTPPAKQSDAKLINFFWRPSVKPRDTDLSTVDDPYIAEMRELLPIADIDTEIEGLVSSGASSETHSDDSDAEKRSPPRGAARGRQESNQQPPMRERRPTVFACDVEVPMLPDRKLRELFQARAPSFDMHKSPSMRTLITESKHLQCLEILVKNYTIRKQVTVDEAVDGLVVAIRQCDYDQLEAHMLGGLQKVVEAHLQDGQDGLTVLQYAERHGGPEALSRLEHPHAHRLLHGVASIPEVSARLECMHRDATFDETMEGCMASLKVLRDALQKLISCLVPIQTFFAVCLQVGNAVNKGSAAPVAKHGFKLCSLPKLLEVRSPAKPGLSLFHIAVLMMSPAAANQICSSELNAALLQARLTRTASVYQECLRALESYQALASVARTGFFKGREIPRTESRPRGGSARLAAAADNFWPRMMDLARRGRPLAANVLHRCISVMQAYKDIAVFFDDVKNVWPPPRDDGDPDKQDLFGVFHEFVSNFARARSEVEAWRLVSDVQKHFGHCLPLGGIHSPAAAVA